MSRTVSAAFQSAARAQQTGDALLALIEITHESISDGPLRFVQDLQPLVSQGHSYTAFPFEIRLPDDADDGPATVQLTIDAVDRAIALAIRRMPPTSPPVVTVSLVLASQPDVVELMIPDLTLRSVRGDLYAIEGELRMDEEDLAPFPQGSFTPQEFPGMFA